MQAQTSTTQKWLVLIAVGVGTFMSALDGSVVNTILPVIRATFQSDVAAVQWVVVVYLLVISGLLLTFGRLGDMRGHRITYLWGFAIFTAGSALCGLAPTATWLVIFRAVQAVGGAMIASNAPAILTSSFPAVQRGQALGIQATMTYLGLTVGPSFGGWLADTFTWRAVFSINIPVGLAALWLSWHFVPRDQHTLSEQFDLPGAALFISGLVALLLGLNQGHNWGWSSPAIVGLLVGAVLLLGVFVWREARVAHPMLDLRLFQRPLFSSALSSAVLNYVALYSILFLMPFYLIQARGLNTAQAGLLLTAQPLVMAVAAPLAGMTSDRVGSRLLTTLGMLILSLGLALLARLDAASPLFHVSLGLAVCGLGTGIFVSPNNSALMGSAPRGRQGIAAGMLATARNVGMVLGVGLAGAILSTMTTGQEGRLVEAVRAGLLVAAGVALLAAALSVTRASGKPDDSA